MRAVFVSPLLLELINSDTCILPNSISLILLIKNLLINDHMLSGAYIATGNKIPMYKSYVITSIATILLQLLFVNFTSIGIYGVILSGLLSNLVFNKWY